MIGMDGVKPSALEVANTPNIDRLVKNGMVSWNAVTQSGNTVSTPGWTSI